MTKKINDGSVSVVDPHGNSIEMKVVRVTPRLAELWLKNNHVNRRLDQKRVKRYARDMVAGNWLLNPSA